MSVLAAHARARRSVRLKARMASALFKADYAYAARAVGKPGESHYRKAPTRTAELSRASIGREPPLL